MKIGHFIRLPRTRLDLSPLISIGLVAVVALAAVFILKFRDRGQIGMPGYGEWLRPERPVVTLFVRSDGSVFFGERKRVQPDDLKRELLALKQAKPTAMVHVGGSVGASLGDVVRVLDEVRLAGFHDSALVGYPSWVSEPPP